MRINGGGGPPGHTSDVGASATTTNATSGTTYDRVGKPILDRVLGGTLLVLASPIIILAAAAILVSSGRPIFYGQTRIGKNGQAFKLYKLRTMIPDRRVASESYRGVERRQTHKSPDDPRVTRVGRLLRSARLDELPQFWNVVKGDMSLVGPRPEMAEIVERYEPWQHQRHVVKPGVTGFWQISERNGKPMHECTEIDLDYITRMSFATDLKILAKTPLSMLGQRRGY